MRFLIIANDARFYHQLHVTCRCLHPHVAVEHTSCEHWRISSEDLTTQETILIADGRESSVVQPEQITQNAFAVIGTVCQNSNLQLRWESFSRSDVVLWLRELSPMATEAGIAEDVLVQSPHVRVAQFRVPTRCELIPVLRDRLLQGLREYHVVKGTRENHFCMALEEALNNAFYHGNLEISSELKEDGSSRFIELAAERELLSPWCRRCVRVIEMVSAFGLWITISDEGSGFNVQAALDRCNDPESLLASGRGLLMMRAFSDELFFNSAGNEVNLVLYAEGQDRELPLGTRLSKSGEKRLVLA